MGLSIFLASELSSNLNEGGYPSDLQGPINMAICDYISPLWVPDLVKCLIKGLVA
jgi:hypothetical protein